MIWVKIDLNKKTFSLYEKGLPLFYTNCKFLAIKEADGYLEITTEDLRKISIPSGKCILEDIY